MLNGSMMAPEKELEQRDQGHLQRDHLQGEDDERRSRRCP